MARGLEAGSFLFLFGLEVEEEEGGMILKVVDVVVVVGGKEKKGGGGFNWVRRVDRFVRGWMTWDGRIGCLFFNIILFVSVSCERLLLNIDGKKES